MQFYAELPEHSILDVSQRKTRGNQANVAIYGDNRYNFLPWWIKSRD
jgi:hypothetical protein